MECVPSALIYIGSDNEDFRKKDDFVKPELIEKSWFFNFKNNNVFI